MENYLFEGRLADTDSAVDWLIKLETERQKRKLIMIPSESFAPQAVRESLASVFQNIYAEGYPDEDSRALTEPEILDYESMLGNYRRNSDPRYYKGVEYVDILEPLARRRCAEVFANSRVRAEEIFVNVQPLSGAPANNAVYHLIQPGDTVLAMDLLHGGHLTHGSPVNRTGLLYNIIHYTINPDTGVLDYDEIQRLATEHRPRMIIAGYTSYPYIPDWKRYREIADSVGAYLFVDMAHIAGLVAAGVIESPLGYGDAITFTTHKTLTGPRGAVILTTDPKITKIIDKAVFPGEQGGPHTQVFAALATTLKIAKTEAYRAYQQQVLDNIQALIHQFNTRGIKVAYHGSDSHMLLLDCKVIKGEDGTTLSGDLAARILDLAGIVLNRNTIPGDKSALRASGIRMGTSCITQIGLNTKDMIEVADIIADLLYAIHPYTMPGVKGPLQRARVDFSVFEACKIRVRKLCEKHTVLNHDPEYGYPHFYYLDDHLKSFDGKSYLKIHGEHAREFVNYAFLDDAEALAPFEYHESSLSADGTVIHGCLTALADGYQFECGNKDAPLAAAWLRALSDGFVRFDKDYRKRLPGPVAISESSPVSGTETVEGEFEKAYAVGKKSTSNGNPLPAFDFSIYEGEPETLQATPLNSHHKSLGAKMAPFAGWDMPLWYTSIKEEHAAVRNAAGLFDVSHMGVYLASGPDAVVFLNSVVGNDVSAVRIGDTCYTHFLDPKGQIIDDLIIYRIEADQYLIVVNAANDDKDWAWLNAVREDKIQIDLGTPEARAFGRKVILENLRDPAAGERRRVDLALQGQISTDILRKLSTNSEESEALLTLKKGQVRKIVLGGFDLIIARTGYTGERISYELFVHPDRLADLWTRLLEIGGPLGLKPCGLGSRDSLRIEAGLPLYGHELAGPEKYTICEAGLHGFVKTYKPWFIGRTAYREQEASCKRILARFRFTDKTVRLAHFGDPIMDTRGKVVGRVTSCAQDLEGWIMGLAMLDPKFATEGTPLYIYQNSEKAQLKEPGKLADGEKTTLPNPAVVISRFPKAGKKA